MNPRILGLHHVTATVDDAQRDLDFYRRLLGLRLVKKTVNFDNRGVYHFYYGTETGTPGTIMTTFPYKGMGVPVGRKGSGQITRTAFSIPGNAAEFWRERLREHGVTPGPPEVRQGEEVLRFLDPSGLEIELIATAHDPREPWTTPGVGEAAAIRGIHTLSLSVAKAGPSIAFLQQVLGFDLESGEGDRTRLGVSGGGPGRSLDLVQTADQGAAANGLGTVHHLALAVESAEAQLAFRERLLSLGVPVTEVLDRQYFRSIYFREPGNILYEIATVPPGFTVDEPPEELGRALKLPPWEEANRVRIEAVLPAVTED